VWCVFEGVGCMCGACVLFLVWCVVCLCVCCVVFVVCGVCDQFMRVFGVSGVVSVWCVIRLKCLVCA
jgi:hypothetical protein